MISLADTSAGQEPTDWVEPVREIFSQSGLLSRASNFEYRPEQQQMAMAVASALQNRQHLLVEAGTGVGKSFAGIAEQEIGAAKTSTMGTQIR